MSFSMTKNTQIANYILTALISGKLITNPITMV